jgi:hypothetical protein
MLRTLLVPVIALLGVAPSSGQANPGKPAKPFTMAQVWKMDAVYKDKQHGLSFRYPSVWKPATQFGYHPPALLMRSDVANPIVGFGYKEGGFPRQTIVGPYTKTNLEGFGIVYAAIPVASSAECEAKAASLSDKPEHGQAIFGSRTFSVYETGEWGMSQSTVGRLYATYSHSICYFFETDVSVASPEVVDHIQPLTHAQRDFIEAHLLEIMRSVRIAPRQ